jgi:hypothetical protein
MEHVLMHVCPGRPCPRCSSIDAKLNRNKMRVLLKTGKIPARKVGRTWIVPRASIDAFMFEPQEKIRLQIDGIIKEDVRAYAKKGR